MNIRKLLGAFVVGVALLGGAVAPVFIPKVIAATVEQVGVYQMDSDTNEGLSYGWLPTGALDAFIINRGSTKMPATVVLGQGLGITFAGSPAIGTLNIVDLAMSRVDGLVAALDALETAIDGKEDNLGTGSSSEFLNGERDWVDIAKSDVGLGNVDNTSDADKPVSTAQATALSGKQAADADLDAWAGKTAPSGAAVGTTDSQTLTNKVISYLSNTITVAAASIADATTLGRNILTAATAGDVRTLLGLVIGTNVQAWDADLDTWATKTAPSGTTVGTTDTQTLTGKTVNGSSNTLTVLAASQLSGATPIVNGGTDATTAAGARANLAVPTLYQNQTIKTGKIWTGSATTTSGVATFYPTDNNASNGNAIFTNIYSIQVSAVTNTGTVVSVPFASVKAVAGDNKSITANAVTGRTLALLGDTVAFAPNGTTVYMTIFGD